MKLKNQFLLKRGSFALITTALLIAAIIVINAFAMPVLSERFHMNYDFSKDKVATLNADNLKFIKNVKEPITVIVTCTEDQYAYYMQNISYQNCYYSAAVSDTTPFEQSVTLIKKYHEYNKNITVKFASQKEVTQLAQQYQGKGLKSVGDIIIQADKMADRYAVIGYSDIYTDNSMEVMQGQAQEYQVTANKIETALSGAISDVLGGRKQKIVLYTRGDETAEQLASYLSQALEENKYTVETNKDYPVKEIADDVALAVLMPSASDLMLGEKDLFSDYVSKNNGKNVVCYTSAQYDYSRQPNFKAFLAEWGVTPENGMIIDTAGNYYSDEYGILVSLPDYEKNTSVGYLSSLTEAMNVQVDGIKDVTLVESVQSAEKMSVVPFGKEQATGKTGTYPIALRLQKATADEEGNETVVGTLTVFSSIDFAYPDMFTMYGLQCNNRDLVLDYFSKLVNEEETQGIDFGFKSTTTENFVPNDKETSRVKAIFIWVIPMLTLATGVAIYVWRRRSR